ncbi:MAG: DUF1007 family protein [Proteobacteria bacterium]|nr:DUF1007 family protein [Pseudomonadota bacterium]
MGPRVRGDDRSRLFRFALGLLALVLAFATNSAPASAHPHVWVTSSSELLYAPDGALTGVRHVWTFDRTFSAYAVEGIESKTKGVYSREELAPLAQTNVESLKEFGFFTFAKAEGKKHKFLEPVDYFLEYRDEALVLHFTLPLKTPFKTKQLALEIYDPTYFVDFALAETEPVKLVGAPASCGTSIERPTDGSATAKQLSEDAFENGDNSTYGARFANKITVDCP